jgi:hypothetical protein
MKKRITMRVRFISTSPSLQRFKGDVKRYPAIDGAQGGHRDGMRCHNGLEFHFRRAIFQGLSVEENEVPAAKVALGSLRWMNFDQRIGRGEAAMAS